MLMLGYAVLQSKSVICVCVCVCVCVCTRACMYNTCRRAWPPTTVILPGESHGQSSLAGYGPQSRKESDVTEATQQHAHIYLSTLFRFPYHLGHHRAMSRVPCVKQELRLKKIPPYFKISILVCFRKNCYFVKFVLFVMKLTRTVSHTFSVSD